MLNHFSLSHYCYCKYYLQGIVSVVYFNQQTHSCAYIRMVKNNKEYLKMTKRYLFHYVHERHTRGLRRGLQRKTKKKVVGQQLGVTPKSWLTPKALKAGCSLDFFCIRPPLGGLCHANLCDYFVTIHGHH